MGEMIDLRSDTVTKPTDEMRKVMMQAEVGDAAYGEDPTVNKLQDRIAQLLGKEAALFVPTGTMANAIGIKLSTQPGDEVIVEASSHPVLYEAGGSAIFSGVIFKQIPGRHGILLPEQVKDVLNDKAYYRPRQSLISLEITHNRGGGTIYPLDVVIKIARIAKERGLRMHLDGARLWNASVASGIPMKEYAKHFDTVTVCFSKGLGAPIGSAIAGCKRDIERAWHIRHALGGSWRQAGILAAAALYAIDHHVERLAEDHANARLLKQGLEELGFEILHPVQTNMVYFTIANPERYVRFMRERGVLLSLLERGVIRAVTHLGISRKDIEIVVDLSASYLRSWRK